VPPSPMESAPQPATRSLRKLFCAGQFYTAAESIEHRCETCVERKVTISFDSFRTKNVSDNELWVEIGRRHDQRHCGNYLSYGELK